MRVMLLFGPMHGAIVTGSFPATGRFTQVRMPRVAAEPFDPSVSLEAAWTPIYKESCYWPIRVTDGDLCFARYVRPAIK